MSEKLSEVTVPYFLGSICRGSLLERLLTRIIPYNKRNLDSTICEDGFNHQMCQAPIFKLTFSSLSNRKLTKKKPKKKVTGNPTTLHKTFLPLLCTLPETTIFPLPILHARPPHFLRPQPVCSPRQVRCPALQAARSVGWPSSSACQG